MSTTPKTGITELSSTAANQATVVNSGWAIVDQILDRTVKDKDLSTPPASPADGDAYIVASGNWGTGSSKAGQIAYWRTSAGVWQFIAPRTGWVVRVADELDAASVPREYGYTGSAWVQPAGNGGLSGGTLTGALNEAPSVTLASASSVAIGAANANAVKISGTTTITAFDSIADGAVRRVEFVASLTLTHNGTSLILPTGASITTAAGDCAEFRSLGSGNWKCISYTRANGQALSTPGGGFTGGTLTSALNEAPPVTIASSSTVSIGAAAANSINITGTTTITAFDAIAAGAVRHVVFSGALTLTHNGTSLILPTSANISTASGDSATFESLGGGNWRCTSYLRSSGAPVAGSSGLTNFAESLSISTPNTVTYAAKMIPLNAGAADIDYVIEPKGNGALIRKTPDNAASGGAKRGARATDLQASRSAAAQVASGSDSFAAGANNTSSGAWSTAVGYNNNSGGQASVAVGGSNLAQTTGCVALGQNNTASADQAVAMGSSNTANATQSVAIGSGNTASGSQSMALGANCTASGANSVATGYFSTTRGVIGAIAHASGRQGTTGDSQELRLVSRCSTVDTTATRLTADGTAASATNQVLIPTNSAIRFRGEVVARNTATGDCATWSVSGLIKNVSGTVSLVGTPSVTLDFNDAGAASWVVSVSADNTNKSLAISVTGVAATTIRWVSSIVTCEVTA